MKHIELTVGMEVALGYGHHFLSRDGAEIPALLKATIVNPQRMGRPRKRSSSPVEYKPSPKGQFLEIRYSAPSTPESGTTMPTSYISIRKVLGPWGEVVANNNRQIEEAVRRTLSEENRLDSALSSLRDRGIEGVPSWNRKGDHQITLTLEEVERLLRDR